ncbi:MAG: translocation/assembly module TamB, partial [Leadbetterella sp.]|nr:translocation/assembly module TamB [Leadbetterella sp.]
VYDLKDTKISSLYVSGNLGAPAEDTTSSGPLPDVRLKGLTAQNINWDIDLGEQYTSGSRADVKVDLREFDLPRMQFEAGRLISSFEEVTFKDKKALPPAPGEINFGNLALSGLKFSAEDLLLKDSVMAGKVTEFRFRERSGLELTRLNVQASLKGSTLLLEGLDVATAASELKATLKADLDTAHYVRSRFDAVIAGLKLAPSEAFFFDKSLAQTLASVRNERITGRGRIKGTVEEMSLDNIYLTATSNTRLTLNGKLFNRQVFGMDLQVSDFSTTRDDLTKFAGGGLPETIELPENLVLNGSVKGNMEDLTADVFLNSSQGGARLAGNLKALSRTPVYSGTLTVEDFAAGRLIRNAEVGKLRGTVTFEGTGFDNPAVKFDGQIDEAGYGGEIYRNIVLNGKLEDRQVTAAGSVRDTKARLTLDAVVDMRGETVTVTGNTRIEQADLKALGVTKENLILKGDFDINRLVADLKKPFIDFKGQNITIQKDSATYPIGDLTVLTEYGETLKRLDLTTRFMNLSLSGNFEYDKLQSILMTEVNKYFKLPDFQPAVDTLDYYFDINGTISYDPVFTAFVPLLRNFKPVTINSGLKSDGEIPFAGHIAVPYLLYDSIQVVNTTFDFTGNGTRIQYGLLTDQVSTPAFRLRKADLHGKLEENVATFDLSVKDSVDREVHSLAGFLESDGSRVRVSFDETGSKLFYEDWGGNPYGYIDYSSAGLYVNNVVFSSGEQVLRINSVHEEPNGPLTVFAEKLDLNFLSRAILQDSTLASGYLDLDLQMVNYMGDDNLAFTGEADIDQLHFNQVALGDLRARAESDNLEEIRVYATLSGLNNDFELKGAYFTQKEESLDFTLDIGSLDIKALEPFLEEVAYEMRGRVKGDVNIKGSPAKPRIDGSAVFDSTAFRIKETAALLRIHDQSLKIEGSKILFEKLLVKDANGRDMTLNGAVDLSGLPAFRYDLDITTDNFLIADSERGQSELFYGTAYLDSKLNVRGTNSEFRLTGDITSKDKTNLTLLLPDESVGEDLNAVVTFVDFANPDKVIRRETRSALSLANAVNINVVVDEKSTINMLMNPITGDMLSASGNARLNIGFDNAGDLFIIGQMNIVKGSYELTFQTIKKRFEIVETSKSSISFAGDPLKGVMDITAEYKVPGRKDVNTYPGLDQKESGNASSGSEQNSGTEEKSKRSDKIFADIRVDLILRGEVMSLSEVDFQIVAKESEVSAVSTDLQELGWSIVNDRGEKKSGTEGAVTSANREVLKQNAIMLLVAGNFSADQIFDSFTSSGGAGYEDLARRNVSQMISSQLERYASGLIKGVDLNVGLQSSGGAAEGGSDRSTNLNLGVSKRLANDRLIFSVGKNFELENKDLQSDEIFDNVEANWLITTDGRYRLKVFRKNRNQSAIEGSVIETGLGFIIAIDYDTWKELMKRKK